MTENEKETKLEQVQEIRAKRVLDRLTLMNEPKTQVVRSGQMLQVDSEQLDRKSVV